MEIQILLAFITYVLVLMGIAYFFSLKDRCSEAFILGGRSTNYWVTAVALQASDMSHWLFLGIPGLICSSGVFMIWELLGLVLFMFLSWQFVAPKLRQVTEQLSTITLFSYFEKRFNDTSGIIRITAAIISIIFFTYYISSGLVALGRVFHGAFGMDYHIGTIIGLVTILIYTLLGGFLAVAWCDFFQGVFAITMMVLVAAIAYYNIDGWHSVALAAQEKALSLSMLPSWRHLLYVPLIVLSWGPGYFGQPQLLAFFMGIKDPKNIKYAKVIGMLWQIIIMSAAVLVGLIGLAYFKNGGEMTFVFLAKTLFSPFIAGLVLCAILAATLTTLDSQILSSGTIISQDIYKKIFKKDASNCQILWMSRIGSLLISFVALLLSFDNSDSVYKLVNYAWSGMGSAFAPLVILSLYSQRVTKYGAFSGIIVGAVTAGIWPYINTAVLPLVPGFALSFISIWFVSCLTQVKMGQ